MLCCTGNGTQGLYYAWEGALRELGQIAQVNLLLNRAGKLVEVESWLPYKGRIRILNKTASRMAIRIPAWVNRRELRVQVGGNEIEPGWISNRIFLQDLTPGQAVTLAFPVKESQASYSINAHSEHEQVYTCTFRGSTCVDISPRDEDATSYPLYLRDHLRTAEAPMKPSTRHAPDRVVSDW